MRRVAVTGAAGFIGFHLSKRLVDEGYQVLGIDNFNDYYSVRLKEARAAELDKSPRFCSARLDIADASSVTKAFSEFKPDTVVNLAAQPGVRYSLENPRAYADSNI